MSNFGGKVATSKKNNVKQQQNANASTKQEKPSDLEVEIKPDHAFGLYTNSTQYGHPGYIRDTLGYLAESKVVHPVGQKAAMYQLDKHRMDFFELNPNVKNILGMAIATNRKRVAFCEQGKVVEGKAPHGQVSVYHAIQGVHLRTLTFPNMKGEFISVCFTKDTKFLIALGSAPENLLVYWKWSNMKLIAHTKLPSGATRVRVNPADASMITTSGPEHLKLWRLEKDLSLKSVALLPGKTETKTHFVDHAWMRSKGLLLALTSDGNCYVFEVDNQNVEIVQSMKIQYNTETHHRFETIETFKKGFVASGTGADLGGYMCVYEHTDDRKEPFMLIKYFYTQEPHLTIANLAISPLDEQVGMFVQPTNQFMTFPLVNIDTLDSNKDNVFNDMRIQGFHTGKILDIDICTSKPWVVTCGADQCVKVWSFQSTRSVTEKSSWECKVTHKAENDEPYCVAFHPSGLQVLVGFKDNVQIYNVLNNHLDEARPTRLNLKNSKLIRFAPGGQYFAVSFGISIEVYNSYTFELVKTLMGHIRRVRSLTWFDNNFLYTSGEDGSIYGWDIGLGKKVDETTVQKCVFSGIASDRQRPIVCAAGNDKKLYEVRRNDQGETEYSTCEILGEDLVTELIISNANNALICGTATGCVRVYPWPLGKHADPSNYQELRLHNGQVNNLTITNDDFYVLSAGDDGTIFATRLSDINGVRSSSDGTATINFNYNAILVDNEQIEMQNREVKELKKTIEDVKSRHELESAMQSKVWHDQLKQKTEEMDTAISAERERFETLNQRHEAYSREHMEEIDKREAEHVTTMQALENEYEHKLAVEIARYDDVSEAMERQQQDIASEIDKLKISHMERLKKLEEERIAEVNELQQQIELLNEELKKNQKEYTKILDQQTQDDDQEILVLQKKREQDEEAFHEMVSKMTAMLHVQTDRCEKLQAKMEEVQEVAKVREQEYLSLKKSYYDLQDMLRMQERQLDERDVALQQKERTILGLRSKHSTLENFKYVLNHRIQMLSKEKGPVAEHIDALEKHIRDMYEELVKEFHMKKLNTRALDDSQMKMKGLQTDIRGLTASVRSKEREIKAFQHQLTTIINYIDPKDYEDSMNDLYRTFVKKEKGKGRRKSKKTSSSEEKSSSKTEDDDDESNGNDGSNNQGNNNSGSKRGNGGSMGGAPGEAQAAVNEANRQRDYMEKTVHTLKKTLKLAGKKMQRKSKMSMEENSLLISECNSLRRETTLQKRKIEELKSEVNMLQGNNSQSQSALDKVRWRKLPVEETQPPMFDPRSNSAWSSGSGGSISFGLGPGLGPEIPGSPINTNAGHNNNNKSNTNMNNKPSTAMVQSNNQRRNDVRSRQLMTAPKPLRMRRPNTGQIIRGSTRPLMESANAKNRVNALVGQLEDNNREIEMQRMEIKRLRDQVHALVNQIERGMYNHSPTISPKPSDLETDSMENLPSIGGGGHNLIMKAQSTPALR